MLSTKLSRVTNIDRKCQGVLPPTKLLRKKETWSLSTKRGCGVPAPGETRRSQYYQRLLSVCTTRDWKISIVEAADCLERTQWSPGQEAGSEPHWPLSPPF